MGKREFVKKYAIPADADLIIIQLLSDDLRNNTALHMTFKKKYRELSATTQSERYEIAERVEKSRNKRIRENKNKSLRKFIRKPLKDLKQISESENTPICVFYISQRDFPSSSRIEKIAEEEGIEYLDVGRRYKLLPENRRRIKGGNHPSIWGHRELGKILYSELKKGDSSCSSLIS